MDLTINDLITVFLTALVSGSVALIIGWIKAHNAREKFADTVIRALLGELIRTDLITAEGKITLRNYITKMDNK